MVEMQLQRGPNEEFYYSIVDESGLNQLVCARFENKDKLTRDTV
jgi:hypothetical protein